MLSTSSVLQASLTVLGHQGIFPWRCMNLPTGPLEITNTDNIWRKKETTKKKKHCTNVLGSDNVSLAHTKKSKQNFTVVNGLVGSLSASISHGSHFSGSQTVGIDFTNVNHDLRQQTGNYLNCLLYWCVTDCIFVFFSCRILNSCCSFMPKE